MKHIEKHINKYLQTEQSQHSTNGHEERTITRLFKILAADYGNAFTSRFVSSDDLKTAIIRWGKVLDEFTPAEIALGLDEMPKKHRIFPPNVHEFAELCRSAKKPIPKWNRFLEFQPVQKATESNYRKVRDKIKKRYGI